MDAGTRRVAYYNNLNPGSYTFWVIACNNDGVWNEQGKNVKFSLQPRYWQTWWFKTFVILSSLSFVGTTVRYATKKRMQFKLERLEQQHAVEKERTRIAQDMHDEMGACLTQITVLTELTRRNAEQPARVMQHTDQISGTAHELIQKMGEIVWAVNPKNDNLDELADYIFQYVENLLSLTQIRLRVDRPDTIPKSALRVEVRHNVFLTVKEAVNNILKHAKATEIRLKLAVTDAQLQIIVEDNGVGIEPKPGGRRGNGLSNMKTRIEDIGGQFALESQPGNGTKIALRVGLPEKE